MSAAQFAVLVLVEQAADAHNRRVARLDPVHHDERQRMQAQLPQSVALLVRPQLGMFGELAKSLPEPGTESAKLGLAILTGEP